MGYKVPDQVKNALYSDWFFKPQWNQMHNSNAGNNLGVVVGGNGTGKSWLQLWIAETLGVDHKGSHHLFDKNNLDKHLFFTASDFIKQCNVLMKQGRRNTIGYQFILDEGQLSLYSKEAFNEEVKNLSRMLMTIRSRRWGVYINLPSFGMLNKDVRTITNWLIHMKGKPKTYSYGTFYNVETNMVTGDPYLKKPVFSKKEKTLSGVPIIKNTAFAIIPFPKPSESVIESYEYLKAEHQKKLYEKFGFIQEKIEEKDNAPIIEEDLRTTKEMQLLEQIKANPDKFKGKNGKYSISRIIGVLGASQRQAYKLMSML